MRDRHLADPPERQAGGVFHGLGRVVHGFDQRRHRRCGLGAEGTERHRGHLLDCCLFILEQRRENGNGDVRVGPDAGERLSAVLPHGLIGVLRGLRERRGGVLRFDSEHAEGERGPISDPRVVVGQGLDQSRARAVRLVPDYGESGCGVVSDLLIPILQECHEDRHRLAARAAADPTQRQRAVFADVLVGVLRALNERRHRGHAVGPEASKGLGREGLHLVVGVGERLHQGVQGRQRALAEVANHGDRFDALLHRGAFELLHPGA